MNIYLIKSRELDPELFTRVVDLLGAIRGPFRFFHEKHQVVDFNKDELWNKHIADRSEFEKIEERREKVQASYSRIFPMERQTADWVTLYSKAQKYRNTHHIPNDAFVILLTDIPNTENWFSSLDSRMPYNGFVHTGDWDHYIDCPPEFPIAYEVVALVLQKHMFDGYLGLMREVHRVPIGCINDLCVQKREIILKLRTADICRKCMNLMKERLDPVYIKHALDILESLRVKMLFAQNFKQETSPSKIELKIAGPLMLPGFGNIAIKLRPLEKALYVLFLRHPEGIFLSSLADHRKELTEIYGTLANSGSKEDIEERVRDLTNILTNSASEKISRIKRVFEDAIGEELARNYIIQGGNSERRKILLDRGLVDVEF